MFKQTRETIYKIFGIVCALFVLAAFITTHVPSPTVHAAPSTYLNFQGRLLSSSGNLVPDGYYNIEFKLFDAASSSGSSQGSCSGDANCKWVETYYDTNGVTAGNDFRVRVVNGYFSVQLSSLTAFSGINWDQQMWLTMNIGGSTQTATPTYDGEMTPRIQLTAVPLAFVANNVNSGSTSTASTNSNAVSIASGNATGSTSNSGNITIDAGTATGTAGTISLGATNTSSLILGRSGLTTLNTGNLTVQGGATTLGTTGQAGSLIVSDGSSSTITIKSATQVAATNYDITVPAITAGDTMCLVTLNNCVGLGVTSIGTVDTAPTSANGARISGSTLFMQYGDGTYPGLVSTTTQTIAGVKTFTSQLKATASNGIYIDPTSTFTNRDSLLTVYNSFTNSASGTRPGIIDIRVDAKGAGTVTEGRVGIRSTVKDLSGVVQVTVTGATNATPIAITTGTAHGFATGDHIIVDQVGGNTAANGLWTITVTGANTFTLDTSIGSGAYTSGGIATNRGLLYGLAINVEPRVDRGGLVSVQNGDDVTGIVVQNTGTANGTDAFYSGRNATLTKDWNGIFGTDAYADKAFYATGQYQYGLYLGSSTISTAAISIPNNTLIVARNAANSGNLNLLKADASDSTIVGNNVLTVESGGDVGINTTNPGYKLEIQGTGATNAGQNFQQVIFDTSAFAQDEGGMIGLGGYIDGSNLRVFGGIKSAKENATSGNVNGYTALYSRTGSTVNEGLRLSSGGNVGIGVTGPDGRLELGGNATSAAWGFNGIQLQSTSATYTDSSTAVSGTATNAAVNSFGTPTLAATNATVTTTNATTVYIQNAPTAGTNQTITNAYALWIDDGISRFDGNVVVNATETVSPTANSAVALTVNGTSGTAATALNVVQTGAANAIAITTNNTGAATIALNVSLTNSSGTQDVGVLIDRTTSGGTTTDLLKLNNTLGSTTNGLRIFSAGGSFINGINFSGTFTKLINSTNFNVTSAGAITAGSTLDIQGASINIGTTAQAGSLIISDGTSSTITIKSATQVAATNYDITVPAITASDTICLQTFANCSGSGATSVGTLDTATTNADGGHITAGVLYLQSATASVPGLVNLTTQTFTGVKTFNSGLTLAASQTVNFTGGVTGSRPGSPTEGMVYFDTTTKQLLTYANGKWQADRHEAILVAASNSTQAEKDAADYVGNGNTVSAGDGDQVEINAALTDADPAGSGRKTGKVYLFAGTYVLDDSILVPNNTTLAGTGRGSSIELGDVDATVDAIQATGSNRTGQVIRDLSVNGRSDLNTANTENGIALTNVGSGSGSGARQGAQVLNTYIINFRNQGIYLNASANNTINGNTVQGNTGDGIGTTSGSSINNTFTGNLAIGNTGSGIALTSTGSNNAITGNTAQGNGVNGIGTSSNTYTTISGNTASGNTGDGINTSSGVNNTITGNTTQGNGGDGIDVGGNYMTVSGNTSNGNTSNGIVTNSDYLTITGNAANNNTTNGIMLNSSSHVEVSGNNAQTNTTRGIYLTGGANNVVASNKIHDNGGATTNMGIVNNGSDYSSTTDNNITDTACTSTCYAIDINTSNSDKTYLSGNRFTGSAANAASIHDLGTNTSYGGQQTNTTTSTNSDISDILFRGSANSTTAFAIQNASNVSFLNVDTSGTGTSLTVTSNSTGSGQLINLTNTTGTQTNGLLVNRNGAGGTTTNLLNLTNTAGTATNGLTFTGTFTKLINAPSFSVANSGDVLVQGASSDTSTSIQVLQNGGGNVFVVDANNSRVGIGSSAGSPSATLQVAGTFTTAGGAVNVNASSNNATNINTGTSTAIITIGNTSNTSALLFAGGTGDITARTADLFEVQTSGSVALATFNTSASATHVLNVIGALTANASQNGLSVTTVFTPTVDGSRNYYGSNFNPTFAGTADNFDTVTFAAINALALFNTSGSGRLQNAIGLRVGTSDTGNRTLANSYGIQVQNAVTTGGVTRNTGIAIIEQSGASNNTNLLIGTSTIPTGQFSIYNSSADDNIFAANTRIGSTTAPTVALDITGSVTATGNAIIQGGSTTLGTTSVAGALVVSDGSSSTITIKSATQVAATNYDITVPAITAGDTMCLVTLNNCVGSGVTAVGAIDTTPTAANGARISGSSIFMQYGDGTYPGLVSTTTQTFAGNKTFSGTLTVANITPSANLTIGTADATGTLLILDDKTGAGDPTGVQGAMYYNSNAHKFRCYEGATGSGTWKDCIGSAGGSSTKVMRFIPEFAGGVLSPDGSDNSGTLLSDFVSGLSSGEGEKHNFYQWSTAQATAQDYDVVLNVQIPSDFATIGAASTFKFWMLDPDIATTNAKVTWSVLDEDETSCFSTDFNGATSATWQQISGSTLGSCSFSANDTMTIKFKVITTSGAGTLKLGEFQFSYST